MKANYTTERHKAGKCKTIITIAAGGQSPPLHMHYHDITKHMSIP